MRELKYLILYSINSSSYMFDEYEIYVFIWYGAAPDKE